MLVVVVVGTVGMGDSVVVDDVVVDDSVAVAGSLSLLSAGDNAALSLSIDALLVLRLFSVLMRASVVCGRICGTHSGRRNKWDANLYFVSQR